MRIVDLKKMSEEERKKALQEQQSLYNERMKQSANIQSQANQQFNDIVSREGAYNTTRETFKPATTRETRNFTYSSNNSMARMPQSSNRLYNTNNSLNKQDLRRTAKDTQIFNTSNTPSLWDRIKGIADKTGYVGSNFVSGAFSGTTGIAQGQLTEIASNLQKGSNMDNIKLGKTVIGLLFPTIGSLMKSDEYNKKAMEILKDNNKTGWEKTTEIALNGIQNAKESADLHHIGDIEKLAGKVLPEADKKVLEFNEKIGKPAKDYREALQEKAKDYDGVTNFIASGTQSLGNMVPSMIATAVTKDPTASLAVMGASVKGQATQEALEKGEDLETATQIGDAKALIEVATEKISGGAKIFGKGNLDDLADDLVKRGAKSKVGRFLLKQVTNAGGEIAEEELSNVLGNVIDKGTTDPDKKIIDTKEALETMGSTAFTTTMLNLLTGGMVNDYRQIENEMNQYRDSQTGEVLDNNSQNALHQAENIINQSNAEPQQSTQNGQNLPTQQINQESNNIAQNGNMEQIDNRRIATEEINNSRISTQEKQQMIEALNSIEEVSDEDIKAIRNVINVANKINQLPTNLNYKDNGEARQKYMKYKNDSSNYDATAVDEVLDSIPTNRNGRRTVKQWLQVANEIGTKIANKSDAEIEKIAYRSWFDEQPTKNITRYDNQAKTNVGFQKLTSDEWLNTINNAVNEARTNNQAQSNVIQNENVEQMLPEQNKIQITNEDNLVSSAKKYNLNYKDLSIENAQKVLEKRGIKARFDDSYFNNESEGGKYILTTDDNGNVTSREIILNPNANEETILQEMAIHELIHDLIASKTKISKDLYNSVLDYLKKDSDFETKRNELAESYLQIKDQDGKYVYSREQKGFDDMINEEAVAKTLQKKFGTQEEVNRLVNYKPSIARNIYDWIVDKLNHITGGRIEKLYWEDVKNKFERAFSEEGNYKNSGNIERHYFNNVDYFDEIEYNKAIPEQLDSKTWKSIDDSIGREELKPGVYETEAFDYANDIWKRYTIMYKEKGEYKIVDSESIDENDYTEGANNELKKYSRETYTGDEGTRGNRVYLERDNKQTKNRKETADDVRLPIRNKEYSDTNRENNIEVNRNKKYEGLEKSSSFNLPRKDMRYSVNTDGSMKDNKTGKKVILDAETGSSDKTLLAIHNLDEVKLKGVLELGGFPVPSIAITNPDVVGHSQFGDISVIFNKNTINPENRANEVYDRDVWSPTVPEINYDINNGNIKEYITKNIDYNQNDSIINDAITSYMYESNLADLVNRRGIDNALKTLKESNSLKYFYKTSVEKGDYKPIMKQANYSNSDSYGNEELQQFLNEYKGEKPLNELSYQETLDLSDTITDIIQEKFYKEAEKLPTKEMQDSYKKLSKEVVDSFKDNYNRLNNFIYSANSMQKNGVDYQVIDKESTLSNISNEVNQEEYERWIDDTFGKLFKETKRGIRNDKEIFTPSGNRRKFNQLYDEYNLSNLVKKLTQGKTKAGQKTFFEGGFGKVSAELSNQFKSIEDIKNNEYRLKNNEEIKPLIEELTQKFNDDLHELVPYRKKSTLYKDEFAVAMETFEDIQSAVQDFAGKSKLDVSTFKKVLNNYYVFDTEKIPNNLLETIIKDLNQMKDIPTDYFEAKPQRAVGFDEIDAIVIPSDLSKEVKQQLKDRGIKTIEYDRNNENERADILKSLNEYKFSKTSESFDEYLTRRIGKEGTRTPLKDLKLPVKEKQEVKVPIKKEKTQQRQENTNRTENLPTKGETIDWGEMERPEGKIRKHYRSIIESSNTTAEAKAIAKELMGSDTYVPESNKKQLNEADRRISTNGADNELKVLTSLSNRIDARITPNDIAVGERLIEYYSKIGDKAKLQEAIQSTAMAGTQAGQTVQALALLNHQTPQGQVTWIQRSVDKMNQELIKKRGEKAQQFDFTPEMQQRIMETKNEKEMHQVLNEIYEELGQQVSKSRLEQIDSWRYFSMLANPKTHIRNIVGNFAMGKTQAVKNKVAGAVEGVVAQFNPKMERTHTLKPASKEVRQFAKSDIENVADRLELNDNKYNPKSRLEGSMKTFKSDTMENTLGKLFKLNDKALEAEDGWGLKSGYVKALSEYMTANKLTPENITDKQLAKARNYAIAEAKEATFHSENAIATAINQFSRKGKLTKGVTDAVLPFVKTPMNVAKAGLEYNPAGLMKTLTVDTAKLRKGNITVNKYIDNLSKGLTGTGIAVLGYAMANAGILKASGGDDDKKEKFDEALGKQSYSIEINGNTYSLDWLAPAGIPLFVGAEAHNIKKIGQNEKDSISTDDDKKSKQIIESMENWANAMSNSMSPMAEMSMISGLTSALKSYDQDSQKMLGTMGTNAVKSYVNQFVPTALGQVARTSDEYERSTTSTKTGVMSKAIDQTKLQVMSKVPGLRQQLPVKTDVWGNDQKQEGNIVEKSLKNAVLPFTIKSVSNSKVDKELNDLYNKTGETSILPTTSLDKTYTINDQKYRMTNEEYTKYKKDYGQNSYKLLDGLVSSKEYKGLTNEQKQKAIESIYSYAKEKNKMDYATKNKLDVKPSTIYNTMEDLKKNGGNQSSYLNYVAQTTGMEKESEKNKVLSISNYSAKTKDIIYKNGTGKDDDFYNIVAKNTNLNINEYLDYKIKSSENVFEADKDANGKSISGSAKLKIYNYVNQNITGYENRLLILANSYKLSNQERQDLANYINRKSSTNEELIETYKKLTKNFDYRNGKVYYK